MPTTCTSCKAQLYVPNLWRSAAKGSAAFIFLGALILGAYLQSTVVWAAGAALAACAYVLLIVIAPLEQTDYDEVARLWNMSMALWYVMVGIAAAFFIWTQM